MDADERAATTATPTDPDLPEACRLATTIRPQRYGNAGHDRIREPVVEPAWSGIRVIAAASGDDTLVLDDGTPIEGQERLRWHLAHQVAAAAEAVIVDGYLTKQVVSEDARIWTGTDELPSTGSLIAQSMVGTRRDRAEEAATQRERETEARSFGQDDLVNLVVTDVLWLDGDWLLDVPLLERRRLLESIIPGDEFVRAGPYVRPPLQTWIGSWRAQGFLGITFKEANSRYRPGETAQDWTTTSMPRR